MVHLTFILAATTVALAATGSVFADHRRDHPVNDLEFDAFNGDGDSHYYSSHYMPVHRGPRRYSSRHRHHVPDRSSHSYDQSEFFDYDEGESFDYDDLDSDRVLNRRGLWKKVKGWFKRKPEDPIAKRDRGVDRDHKKASRRSGRTGTAAAKRTGHSVPVMNNPRETKRIVMEAELETRIFQM